MKILVTGGAGFIGSHTCLALLEKGHEVIVVDSYVNSNEKSIKRVIEILKLKRNINDCNIKVLNVDIRDNKKLEELFLESQALNKPFDAVIHFAGLKSVKDSVMNPLLYWDVNVNGSINLLSIMNKYKCRTIVFSSSATVYSNSSNQPLKENTDLRPINPYGNTKVAIEKLLNDIFNSNPDKWKIAILRYFNPIGAHPSGMLGEATHDVPNNIFPYITQVAALKLERLTIFGNDWPTLDGTGVRDYIHIMDLSEGHISALEHLFESENKIINLNLGTGIGTSVLELVNTFEKVTETKIPIQFSSRRLGDSSTIIADNSLASSCLNWSPKRGLEQMCIDGWKWQLLNPNGYK
tara:strand:+ start:2106 stop:3158 length:1053 start_codon:yes stop_codon:yes gene_type:complete